MILLRIILIPFSLIYAFIIFNRNKLYDYGILNSVKVKKPVISIGNITTGGTGKTPFTIFTAKYFLEKGKSVGIISRGYKRKSKELVIVCDGKKINDSIEETGDELAMTANSLSDHIDKLFIAASSDRAEAAVYIINNFDPDVIILDDGFQHRRLQRDLDIVIADSGSITKNKFLNSFTLPSGKLRETPGSFKRADLIIQNNKDKNTDVLPYLKNFKEEIILIRYKSEYLINNKNIILETGSNTVKAIIFSGLADDSSFKEMLINLNVKISDTVFYEDHHHYTSEDIDRLKNKFKDDLIFITTEKDFIKVNQFSDFTDNYPVYFLKIEIILEKNAQQLFNNYNKLIN